MKNIFWNIQVVIPSLEPDEKLISYINSLYDSGFTNILVIDDGSGKSYQDLFDSLENKAMVLHHGRNKGKGAALKTGYRWIQENKPDIKGVITADSDGQHSVTDCVKLAERLGTEQKLLLGVRDFTLPNIPLKSRCGNKITSTLFKLLYGQYLSDTQTGLRAFPSSLLQFMIDVSGDKYEYEMNVLIVCCRSKIPIVSIPIETIYENNNEGTHFHPVRDSYKIYKVLLGNFCKFMGSSIISMIVDQGLFNLLNLVVFSNGNTKNGAMILMSSVIARIISASINFMLNRNLVFGNDGEIKKSFRKYVILCVGIMLLSAGGTYIFSLIGLSSTISKILTDTFLYFVSYRMQDQWVFFEREIFRESE